MSKKGRRFFLLHFLLKAAEQEGFQESFRGEKAAEQHRDPKRRVQPDRQPKQSQQGPLQEIP